LPFGAEPFPPPAVACALTALSASPALAAPEDLDITFGVPDYRIRVPSETGSNVRVN
jgi:hypothetical protein